jgi:hypothetical protein
MRKQFSLNDGVDIIGPKLLSHNDLLKTNSLYSVNIPVNVNAFFR